MKYPFRKPDDGGGMDGAPPAGAGGSGGEGSPAEKSNSLFLNEDKEGGGGIVALKTPVLTNKSGNAVGKARFRSFGPLVSVLLTMSIAVLCKGELVMMEGGRENGNVNRANAEGTFNDQDIWKEFEGSKGGAAGQGGFLIDGPAYSSSSSRPHDQGRSHAALNGYGNISEAGGNKNEKNARSSHLRRREGGKMLIKEVSEETTLKNKAIDSANSYATGPRLENRNLETHLPVYSTKLLETSELISSLESFEEEMETCKSDSEKIASIINDNILPNLVIVNPLHEKIDSFMGPLGEFYDKRKVIKMAIKAIPGMGKVFEAIFDKFVSLYKGFDSLKDKLGPFLEKVTPDQFKRLTGKTLGEGEFKTVNDVHIERLEGIADMFYKEEKESYEKSGLAVRAGNMASVARTSQSAIKGAATCQAESSMEAFSSDVLEGMDVLEDVSSICSMARSFSEISFGFLTLLHDMLKSLMDEIEPFIEAMEKVLETVSNKAMEGACCLMEPRAAQIIEAAARIVDFATCWTGSIDELFDKLLAELIPNEEIKIELDFGSFPMAFNFDFGGIEKNENDCSLEFNTPSMNLVKGTTELKFQFQFGLHDILGIEQDDNGGSFLDEIAESCDPTELGNDLKAIDWDQDCCCTARNLELEAGTFCMDLGSEYAKNLAPGPEKFWHTLTTEIVSSMTDFDRCTCCKDGIFETSDCDGVAIGYCGETRPTPKKSGESCPSTADCECEGACGKKSYYEQDKYVCCDKTFVPFSWTTDLCVRENLGDICPTTEDSECAGSMKCGKKSYSDSTYVCCEDTFVPFGWTTDLCVQQEEWGACGTTENAECAGDMGCAISRGDGKYKCCKHTYDCWPWTKGCTTGKEYCFGWQDKHSYELVIYTSDYHSGAGTDSNIETRIGGSKGWTSWHKLNEKISGNAFEKGQKDEVTIWDDKDIGVPSRVEMWSDGAYAGSGWAIETVGLKGGKVAVFDDWLNEGTKWRWFEYGEPMDYRINIKTCDKTYSGTDSDVSIKLYGRYRDKSGKILDRTVGKYEMSSRISGDALERNSWNTFYLRAQRNLNIDIEEVKFYHHGSDGWCAWTVEVETWFYKCRWNLNKKWLKGQQWTVPKAKREYCEIKLYGFEKSSFMFLTNRFVKEMSMDLKNGNQTANGSPVTLNPSNADAVGQMWKLGKDGTIRPIADDSKCLEAGTNPKKYTKALIWDCNGGSHQKWNLRYDGRLQNRQHQQYYLGVAYCGKDPNYRVLEMRDWEHYDCGAAQTWWPTTT